MKRFLSAVLCVSMLFSLAACGQRNGNDDKKGVSSMYVPTKPESERFKLLPAELPQEFENKGKVIVCWGDSITESMAMPEGYRYPQQLQGSIDAQYKVINAGVGGERSDAILSRANAIEFGLTADVVFAKGETTKNLDREMFKVIGGDNIIYQGFGFGLPMENVIIDGKPYTFECKTGTDYGFCTYILKRTSTESLTIKAGTKVRFDYSKFYDSVHCNIVLMGANDGERGAEFIIEKYKKLEAQNPNFIAIIPFWGDDLTKEFKAAFGDKALDIRNYMMTQAHIDYDVTLTELDGYCIKKGMIPGTYNYQNKRGDCHLNELGYKILADRVYKKGVELGYWK